MSNFIHLLKIIFAIASIGLGALMMVGGIVNYSEGKETLGSLIALELILGVFPTVLGTYLLVSAQQKTKKEKAIEIQKTVLALAAQQNGFVLPAEVAMKASISLEKAQEFLENLQTKGFFELRITQKGDVLYRLSGFSDQEEKNNSLDV